MKIFNNIIKKRNKKTSKRNPKFMKKMYRKYTKNHKKLLKNISKSDREIHSKSYKKVKQFGTKNDEDLPREYIEIVCEKCGNCILLEEDMLS